MEKNIIRFINNFLAIWAFVFLALLPAPSSASVEADPAVPTIFARSYWGADESLMTWPVEYAKVQKFIIHHTASTTLVPDTDGSSEYKSMVNNIYRYHTSSKSWVDQNGTNYTGFGDVGYNFLIDPNGNIYEGRKGGNGVIGGHASGFNTGSVGISIVGNYQDGSVGQTNTTLDPKVANAVAKLVGWIAANNGVDLDSSSVFWGKTIDGLVGHKDVAPTQCPGSVIYGELSDVQADASSYAQAYQKYVYQMPGDTAFYLLSGGYKTKFASREEMPETYRSRTVKSITRSQLNAYQFKDLKILPDGTLIQENGAGTVYYLENGRRRALGMDETEFLKLGFKASDIVSIPSNELEYYENGNLIKFGPEGALIKDAANNVYLIVNGKKRIFTSATLFNHLRYDWAKIKADADADSYLDGDAMRYKSGTPVRAQNSPSVYAIENGNKKLFTSGALFERLGYKWSDVVVVAAVELNWYPTSGNMIFSDGTLIRGTGTPTVYLISGGQKREITSATLLYKLGYNFTNVVEIPQESLSDYATGAKAIYPDGTLVKSANAPAVYRIMSGKREEFTSLSVFNAVGAKWGNVIEISPDEMVWYPISGIVKYPENTLLRPNVGEKIYVIKNGQAVWIQSAEEFTKAGYKWSNVLVVDSSEMNLYFPYQDPQDGGSPTVPTIPTMPTTPTNPTTPTAGAEPNIRVAITNSIADSVKITANGKYKVEYRRANGEIYQTLQKSSGEVVETAFFDWDNYIRFVPESDSVIMQILSYEDTHPLWSGKTNDNEFRGVIELRYSTVSKKLWVIEDVPLEEYLKGISEASGSSPAEYLKAFSTISRTYAMYYIQKGGKHTGEPFHLKNSRNGNGNDQQYKGYNLEMRSPKTAGSYAETRGQVIKFNGKPIVAAYSSDSGGVTKSGCEALSANYCTSEFDYLDGGVKDPEGTVHDAAKIAASHGAGMSAVGAYQMAVDGSGWQDIITRYYLGVNIDKNY